MNRPQHVYRDLVVCQYCDTVHRMVPVSRRTRLRCSCCGTELVRQTTISLSTIIALAVAGIIFLLLATLTPLMTLEVKGESFSGSLWTSVFALDYGIFGVVSVIVAVAVFFVPLFQLLLLLYVAIPLRFNRYPAAFALAMHVLHALRPWNLVEVLLLGALVAVTKLSSLVTVSPGIGLAALAAVTVLLTALCSESTESLWLAGEQCQ